MPGEKTLTRAFAPANRCPNRGLGLLDRCRGRGNRVGFRRRRAAQVPRRVSRTEAAGCRGRERGAVGAAFVLLLPVILGALGLVLDGSRLVVTRAQAQAVADFASLAGVQEVDEEAFARGEPALREVAAAATARQWADHGLRQAFGATVASRATIDVVVINASPSAPRRHPWSGRRVDEPTVGVRLTVPVPMAWRLGAAAISLTVAADASVARVP